MCVQVLNTCFQPAGDTAGSYDFYDELRSLSGKRLLFSTAAATRTHEQCTRFPSLRILASTWFLDFLITVILVGVR